MDATTVAAWVGAITGSIGTITGIGGLLWDYYKWKTLGPKLKVSVLPGMVIHQPGSPDHGKRCILVKVANIGGGKTTIITLAFQAYNSEKDFERKNPSHQSIVPNPGPGYGNLPRVLDAGEEWSGMVDHDRELLQMARDGLLYCSIFHTMDEEPKRERVVLREDIKL